MGSPKKVEKDIFLDLLVEYVLDQHPEDVRLRIKAHLDSGCVTCLSELQVLQETMHLMPLALRDEKLRSVMKSRINAAIEAQISKEIEQQRGSQTISHYRLLRRIGFGGMGEVFLAEDTKLGRTAALKVLRQEAASNIERKKRFLREARAAAVLNHPGIATIYEIGEDSGTDFIAMEYVAGKSLSEVIGKKPMELPRILSIAKQLAAALSEAHQRGILHRDLKPENIQIGPSDQAKILDFGLAKFTETRLEDDYTTSSDRVLGTIPYMSPEQILGEPLDIRSDLFSLGSILYEMATGNSPFEGKNLSETMENIVRSEPKPFPAGVPEGLQRIVHRCLRKDPAGRYTSSEGITVDLQKFEKGETFDLPSHPKEETAGISIAVLYFENLSEEKESDYFRAGMTEDIITELSKIKSWQVRPRTQVVKYKDREVDLKEAGKELKVTHFIQGSIRKAGNRVRISAQLVDAQNSASMWADRYDRDLKDIFEIQAEIAQKIAAALQVHLTRAEKKQIQKKRTVNMEAYDFYLRGREMIFLLTKKGIDAAIDYFQQAVETDKKYAVAYAGLAQAYAIRLSFFGGDTTLADRALQSARNALAIDKNVGQAYAAMGLAFFLKGAIDEAVKACKKAIDLNPNDAFATWISGRLAYRLNHYEEAAHCFLRTIDLLPDFYTAYADLSQAYENMGYPDRALRSRKDAAQACRRYLEYFPEEARAHIFLATSSARIGDRDTAVSQGLLAVGLSPDDPVMMYNMACLYSLLNEPDAAVQWLAKSIEQGRLDFEWMKRDPTLENIRNHPRYKELIEQQ